jgi:hypothetical protein
MYCCTSWAAPGLTLLYATHVTIHQSLLSDLSYSVICTYRYQSPWQYSLFKGWTSSLHTAFCHFINHVYIIFQGVHAWYGDCLRTWRRLRGLSWSPSNVKEFPRNLRILPYGSVTLNKWYPLSAKVVINFADKRGRSLGAVRLRTQATEFLCCPDPALGPTHPPIQWVTGALSSGVKWRDVKLTTHLKLVLRSRKHGSKHPPPIRLHGVVLS